jgi:PAP2 superfamily
MNSKLHTGAPSPKKRTLLVASMSGALAACSPGADLITSTSGVDGPLVAGLPTTLTESTVVAKSWGRDLVTLINQLLRELANSRATISRWNQIAIDATGLDHKPVATGENRLFGEQLGPGRSSRAMAIVHIAMYDAVAAITGAYRSVNSIGRAPIYADLNAAIANAAHFALIKVFPSQKPAFDAALAEDLARTSSVDLLLGRLGVRVNSRALGLEVGERAAAGVERNRINDGSAKAEPLYGTEFIPKVGVGIWSPDPISKGKKAIGAYWSEVRPFTLNNSSQFRCPPPPALGSREYAQCYGEVQDIGGDGVTTPTRRTPDQTEAGIFWAYDGTPSLCAPPRLYNQIANHIANERRTNTTGYMRLLMLINVSMADAGIAAWESKYYYQFWRPVTGLRASINGEPNGSSTPNFIPLGAPASNLTGPNFTPPFPAYPSGHAVFGGALFQTLRNFYGTDDIPFTFTSDEYNGKTRDNQGNTRPLKPRYFANLSQAEEENGESRQYLGIHWEFDKTDGVAQGRKVADWVGKSL